MEPDPQQWFLNIKNQGFKHLQKVLYCSVADPNKLNLDPEFSPNLVNGKKNLTAWKEASYRHVFPRIKYVVIQKLFDLEPSQR